MIIRYGRPFIQGYNPVLSLEDTGNSTQMDFGVLLLGQEMVFTDDSRKEKAFLLLEGSVEFKWGSESRKVTRKSFLDEGPSCLHVPAGVEVKIYASVGGSEIVVLRAVNEKLFYPRFYDKEDCATVEGGKGKYDDTSLRKIRTVFDLTNAPDSNLVLGEVVHMPGRWSSYPPHHHPQPEVYYYKFNPLQGFGYSQLGEEVYRVGHNDICIIDNNMDHPQVAAPGYSMFYVWAIRHLEGEPFKERIYSEEHKWLL